MAGPQIDYEALAKEAGAVSSHSSALDYAALAKEAQEPKSFGGFLGNVASSAGKLIGDTAGAMMHPIQTADAMGAIPAGIIEKTAKALGAPVGEGSGSKAFDGSSSKMLDSILDHFKSRYGSIDAAKEALYNDPAGVLADVATVAGGSGAVLKIGGKAASIANAGRVAQVAGKLGEVANTVSSAIDPVANMGRAAQAIAEPAARISGLSKLPGKLYQGSLKPGVGSYDLDEVKNMVATGLENALPVSEGGVQKLHGLVQDLNSQIAKVIDAGASKGVTVDPQAVAGRINQIEPKFLSQVNPERDVKMLDSSSAEFLRQHSIPGKPVQVGTTQVATGLLDPAGNPIMKQVPNMQPGKAQIVPIPADQAQAIKQGTYRQIASNFGELKNGQIEAQKALARGIKEELANAFPEITALNEKESKMLGLQDALERAVRRVDNHDLIGIGAPIAMGATAAAAGAGPYAVAAGILKSVLDNPHMKSRLAIVLDQASRKQGVVRKAVAGATVPAMSQYGSRIQAYLDSLTSPEPQSGPLVSLPAQ